MLGMDVDGYKFQDRAPVNVLLCSGKPTPVMMSSAASHMYSVDPFQGLRVRRDLTLPGGGLV